MIGYWPSNSNCRQQVTSPLRTRVHGLDRLPDRLLVPPLLRAGHVSVQPAVSLLTLQATTEGGRNSFAANVSKLR